MKVKRFSYVIALIAAIGSSLSTLGAESPTPPTKAEAKVTAEAEDGKLAEVGKSAEAKATDSTVEIARRLRRIGHSWVLNEQDREKFSFAITNPWQGKVCAGAIVREVSVFGLFVEHESGGFWCGWDQLPVETRRKYQAILAQAQRNTSAKGQMAVPASKTDPLVSTSAQVKQSAGFAPDTPKEK